MADCCAIFVKDPSSEFARATIGSAGWDLSSPTAVVAAPHTITRVVVSEKFAMPTGLVGMIRMRSSFAIKGLIIVGGVIDADYRGDVCACVYNLTDIPVAIDAGQAFAQILFMVTAQCPVVNVGARSLPPSARGHGGFGSSNGQEKAIRPKEMCKGTGDCCICTKGDEAEEPVPSKRRRKCRMPLHDLIRPRGIVYDSSEEDDRDEQDAPLVIDESVQEDSIDVPADDAEQTLESEN